MRLCVLPGSRFVLLAVAAAGFGIESVLSMAYNFVAW